MDLWTMEIFIERNNVFEVANNQQHTYREMKNQEIQANTGIGFENELENTFEKNFLIKNLNENLLSVAILDSKTWTNQNKEYEDNLKFYNPSEKSKIYFENRKLGKSKQNL